MILVAIELNINLNNIIIYLFINFFGHRQMVTTKIKSNLQWKMNKQYV